MNNLPLCGDTRYWEMIRRWGRRHSDGCSGVVDIYLDACVEHDYHYRFAKDWYGRRVTRAQADARFRRVIQERSPAGRRSVVAWTRWLGVRIFGRHAWETHRRRK